MVTITLNNGSVIENVNCSVYADKLFIYISGIDHLKEYFDLFINPEVTAVIRATRDEGEKVYEGYTNFFSLSTEYDNTNIVLQKR